jgi:hypothetical protein
MWHGNTTAALSIRRELVHRSGEGTTLCNIGVLYFFVTDTIDTSDTSDTNDTTDTFCGSQDVKVRGHGGLYSEVVARLPDVAHDILLHR